MRRCLLAGATLSFLAAATGAISEQADDLVLTLVEPCRLLDTRERAAGRPEPLPIYGPPQLRPGVARSFLVAGQCGVPASAVAVQLNVVATQPAGRGYLVAYPADAIGPATWSLDFERARQAAANAVVVGVGSGGFDLIARRSATHLVVDVVGYYARRGQVRSAGNPQPQPSISR